MSEPTDSQYGVLEQASSLALSYLAHLDAARVTPTAGYDTLRQQLGGPLPAVGAAADDVIRDLARSVKDGLMASAGGRFFGWVRGGSLPVAVAADWLTSAWDQNAALYATGPAAAVVEEVAGDWLKQLLGLPASASFALVTGCQMANVTCLAAARHRLLAARGWNLERDGLCGAPPIRVLAGRARHGSIDRALRLLGIGRAQIVDLPLDAHDRLDTAACQAALTRDAGLPTMLVLQAGDVNVGACDPFAVLIPLARQHGAWVHVDGAFGLWAAASEQYAKQIQGVGGADSWATDGHKWLNVPYDCGYAFVADPEAHRASMACQAAYVTHAGGGRDPLDWNPEWSRRARGFPTYAALRHLGRSGVAGLVERCCDHARDLVTEIGRLPGAEVLWTPTLNQGLVRFRAPLPGATEQDHDAHTSRVIEAIAARGDAFFSGTTWRERRAMRVSVCSWRTTPRDIERTVASIADTLTTVRGDTRPRSS